MNHDFSIHHRVGAVGGDFDILENHGNIVTPTVCTSPYCSLHYITAFLYPTTTPPGDAMIARLAMVCVQAAEEAIAASHSRPMLPPLQRDAVLVIVGADTEHGRERVAQ